MSVTTATLIVSGAPFDDFAETLVATASARTATSASATPIVRLRIPHALLGTWWFCLISRLL